MEGKGSKDPLPPSSSHGIFSSIFAGPPKGAESDDASKEFLKGLKEGRVGPNSKHGSQDHGRESYKTLGDRVEPAHLSSSLYYGGQDVYFSPPTSNQTHPTVKNEGPRSEKDDASGENSKDAPRGNWWQGSLYY